MMEIRGPAAQDSERLFMSTAERRGEGGGVALHSVNPACPYTTAPMYLAICLAAYSEQEDILG